MALQIFVEDQLTDAYEILALRALGLPASPRNRRQVRASRIDVGDLATFEGLLDLTRRGVDYAPEAQRTEDLLPEQASERIAQIIKETGRRLGRLDLRQASAHSIKSRGASIAEHVVPERARRHNFSLAYFYEMSTGPLSGCDHPFPTP